MARIALGGPGPVNGGFDVGVLECVARGLLARRTWIVVTGVGIACLVGLCVASAWAVGPAIRPGGVSLAGQRVWTHVFAVALGGAFISYVMALVLLRDGKGNLRVIATVAVVVQLLPLLAPLLLSTDAWSYWDYARAAAVHGSNPYVVPPSSFPGDVAYGHMSSAWHGTTTVYGPAFTLVSEPIAWVVHSSSNGAAWAFKGLAAAAVLSAAALAGFLSARTVYAAAFVGWNPLLAIDFAGGGHNDAWVAALVLAALALAATGRRRLAALGWAAAIYVKWVPLLLLPLHVLEQRARKRSVDHGALLAALLVGAAVACLAFGPHWLGAVAPLAHAASLGSHFAIPLRLESVGVPHWVALGIVGSALLGAYAWLLRSAHRGRARLGLAAGLVLLAAPYLVSWYTIWAVPLAAAEEDGAAQVVSVGLCAYLLRQGIRV